MMWKIINHISPNDLEFEFIYSDRRGIKVKVPPLNRHATQRSQSLYESSFGVVGPKLWNTIPKNINIITNMATFKITLSRYLAEIPDEPPVDGFTRHNSLLDMNRLQLGGWTLAAAANAPADASVADNDDLHRFT